MSQVFDELAQAGQSIWYDNIERGMIQSGELDRLIRESGVVGITSNPSIFEKAIGSSAAYDTPFRELALAGRSTEEIYESLAVADIQAAADKLRPIYDKSDRLDGYVSIEVSPDLARDTEGTLADARRLHAAVDRPNVMIKVPATAEGIPAIAALIEEGICINITLIFSLAQYEHVARAYLDGLKRRALAGGSLEGIASVASFFVSRIDVAVDGRLPEDSDLRGRAAVASCKLAYQRHLEIFSDERWKELASKGATVQRMLWASTSTKDPSYSDVLYVENLIGPDTVNTVPPKTLAAFADHGKVRSLLVEDLEAAVQVVKDLEEIGIHLDEVGEELQLAGVAGFSRSFSQLMSSITARREAVEGGDSRSGRFSHGPLTEAIDARLLQISGDRVIPRIWERDPTVWKEGEDHGRVIANRLGWLDSPASMRREVARLKEFAGAAQREGFRHVLLLGMGGSSLCPEVLRLVFGVGEDAIDVQVLDSTDPDGVRGAAEAIDLDRSLVLVASKSGTTTEVRAFRHYFADRLGGERRFVAVTDPGTQLEKSARAASFRDVFVNAPDIGGRYSALSFFGLVPAALLGIDVARFLDRGVRMSHSCGSCIKTSENPGARLGVFLGEGALAGRDKLTLFFSPEIAPLGSWIEQLVAESTGKEGMGIVPVDGEPTGKPDEYGSDRLFVYSRLRDGSNDDLDRKVAALEKAGQPVARIELEDRYDLAGEFFRWEFATAVAGSILGIDPFDEPNVKESKDRTNEVLEVYRSTGALPEEVPALSEDSMTLLADKGLILQGIDRIEDALSAHIERASDGDFLAILAYMPPGEEVAAALDAIRSAWAPGPGLASTVGIGPRFLHSTGQLHKGGANTGVFVQITRSIEDDLSIPGWDYSFGTLVRAQAEGDLASLIAHGRRVIRIDLRGDLMEGLRTLATWKTGGA